MNKNYPIYKTTFIDDMRSLVEEAAQNFQDSTAISYKENYWDKEVKKVSFNQWRDDVRHLGTALIADGLREEKIAIVGENSYGWCCAFFGVMAIGSVTVPVDKELPVEDIDGIITTTGCKAVIFGKTAEAKIKELLEKGGLQSVKTLISVAPENPFGKNVAGNRTSTTIAELQDRGAKLYKDGDNSYYDYKIDTTKLASIVFTSGTTGKGKGVMLSQYNLMNHIRNFSVSGCYREDDVSAEMLPVHHVFGLAVLLMSLYKRYCNLFPKTVTVPYTAQFIDKYKITRLDGVPSFALALAELHKTHPFSVDSLRVGVLGGAPSTKAQFDFIEEELGIKLLPVYGQSECIGITGANETQSDLVRSSTVGGFLPMNTGYILDENGKKYVDEKLFNGEYYQQLVDLNDRSILEAFNGGKKSLQGDTVLELFIKPDAPARVTNPEAMGLRHLAFHVEDIEPAVAWLNAMGIETEPVREDPYNGGRFTFFKDPDGLPLELHE